MRGIGNRPRNFKPSSSDKKYTEVSTTSSKHVNVWALSLDRFNPLSGLPVLYTGYQKLSLTGFPERCNIKHLGSFRKTTFAEIFFETPLISVDPQCTISVAYKQENLFYCGIAGSVTNFAIK
ncbi:hypothetical protein TNCV_664951 [Trichonephila clavipes]|uniref:Uncharacterized protein n=1 Tax=Trichonephila clavipes TaxID=2585209 RepID=A0A8X6SFW8_TRICX|nr:hypothetical protein TNCV_664951 [Trichonephila clavipes]